MGQRYDQLSIEERCEIARLRATGASYRQIAAALDRAPSTIAREVRRNRRQNGAYDVVYADQQCWARRWQGSILDRKPWLQRAVLIYLVGGWSPEQVAGCFTDEDGRRVVSYETIYRFIYAQIARTKDYRWRLLLPQGKWKRGWRGRKGGSAAKHIAHRRSVSERPAEVHERTTPGHWEADLMLFATYGQAILTLHERQSRILLAQRLPGKAAGPVAHAIAAMLALFPPDWRRTITFDNGTEFARHYDLHALGLETFFCDTHSPWQKGGIENAIGRMRRVLPRKTDLATISDQRLVQLINAYNTTPRKCLDFQSPAEFFWKQVLHFKCESTFLLSQE